VNSLSVRYRVRQFALALGASINRDKTDNLKEYLEAAQLELFHSMPRVDQHHCLAVFRALREAGETETSLLQAALLHDVGKMTGPVRVWHRVIAVLVNALAPQLWERMGGEPGTWRYPFYVHRQHATLGAELARRAGCSPEAVWLIAHHEDRPRLIRTGRRESELLAALQAADEVK
jgi:putative nucleotidyltransferase with HDIG domain